MLNIDRCVIAIDTVQHMKLLKRHRLNTCDAYVKKGKDAKFCFAIHCFYAVCLHCCILLWSLVFAKLHRRFVNQITLVLTIFFTLIVLYYMPLTFVCSFNVNSQFLHKFAKLLIVHEGKYFY